MAKRKRIRRHKRSSSELAANAKTQKSGLRRSFDVQRVAFLSSLTLIGLHAFIVYILPKIAPDNLVFLKRSWGFHFWTFYPIYIALSLYAIAIVVAIPYVNQIAVKWIEKVVTAIPEFIRGRHVFYVVICLFSWAIFYFGRQKYGFLGDGYLRASDVVAGHITSEGIGTLYLLMWLQDWIGHWDASGILAMQLFSIFWGGLYIILVCLWTEWICNRQYEKVLCAGLMIFIGPIQYFFGYIETYAPLPVFILGFLLSGIIALRDNKPPLWASVCFGAGALMHILLIFLFPAFLCLWWSYFSRRFSIFRDRRIICLSAVVVGLLVYFFGRQHAHVLLPLYPSQEYSYGIFSGWHVWEWINVQVLSAPLGWPLLFLFVFVGHRVFSRELGFLGANTLGALASLFVIDPVLGSRDWDILCLSGIPLMGLATYVVYNGGLNKSLRNYASVFSCACAALLIIPWVHINHTDRSVARVIQILDGDPGSYYLTHPVEMTLARYFQKAKLDSLAMTYYDKAYQKRPLDRRASFNVGIMQLSKLDIDRAIPYFLQALDISSDYPRALAILVRIISHDPKYIASIEKYFYQQYADATMADKRRKNIWGKVGQYAMDNGAYDAAIHIFQHVISEINPRNVSVLNALGVAYSKKGDLKSAVSFFERAYHLSPEDETIVFYLVQSYISQKDTNRAVQILKHALVRAPENRTFLDALEKLK